MPTVPCAGGCPRLVSITMIPGGNPEANREPEFFAAHWTRCDACGRFTCDRCLTRHQMHCPCGQLSRLLSAPEQIRIAQAMAQRAPIAPSGTARVSAAPGVSSLVLAEQLSALGAQVDAAQQRGDFARASAYAEQAVAVVATPHARFTPSDLDAIMRWGEQYFRWRLWDAGAAFWRATLAVASVAHPDPRAIERAGVLGGAMGVLGGRVSETSPQAVEILSAARRVFGPDHVLTQSIAARVMASAPAPVPVSQPPAVRPPAPAPKPASTAKVQRMGFFRELRHGDPNGPSLRAAMRPASSEYESQIVSYLRANPLLVVAMGRVKDVIDESVGRSGSGSVQTDGTWAWPDDLAHYVERYHCELPAAFVEHARARQWTPADESRLDLTRLELEAFAAPPAAPSPIASSALASPPTEPFTLRVHHPGGAKIMLIKIVRELSGLGLADAKTLVERPPPFDVHATARSVNMERLTQELTTCGCRWEVIRATGPSPGVGFEVVLEWVGPSKIAVIKAIRDVTHFGLSEAMALCERVPSRFPLLNPQIAPEAVGRLFAEVGARAHVEHH